LVVKIPDALPMLCGAFSLLQVIGVGPAKEVGIVGIGG
jgi:hypothetical protein